MLKKIINIIKLKILKPIWKAKIKTIRILNQINRLIKINNKIPRKKRNKEASQLQRQTLISRLKPKLRNLQEKL